MLMILPFISGCTLLNRTEFFLLSQSVSDDNGFPSYSLRFNTTGTIIIEISGPQGLLYEKMFFKGVHDAVLPLGEYRHTPSGGIYSLRVFDEDSFQIFENTMTFAGPELSIDSVDLYWWDDENSYTLVGVQADVFNSGDVPLYPDEIVIDLGAQSVSSQCLPQVVLPYDGVQVAASIFLPDVFGESTSLTVSILSKSEDILAMFTDEVEPVESVDELVFSWRYKGSQVLRLPDLSFLYLFYRDRERFVSEDYAAYVFDGYDDPYIDLITTELQERMTSLEVVESVNFIASFVQDIRYATDDTIDPSCAEYPRFPLETLVDGRGDCEDKAILAASILDAAGVEVALLRLPNHMAVGVHLSEEAIEFEYYIDGFYFLETTRNRWVVGKVPDEYVGLTNASVYLISERPILLHSWEDATRYTTSDGADYVTMKIIVENIGSGMAQSVTVQGAFFTMDNLSRNPRSTVIYSLGSGEKEMVRLEMDVPQEVTTILRTELVVDGVVVHDKESTSTFP